MRARCLPLFSLCHPERSLRSEGSRASARVATAGAGRRSVRRDSSLQQLPFRMTQKSECVGIVVDACALTRADGATSPEGRGNLEIRN
jgi:hypothetical protein